MRHTIAAPTCLICQSPRLYYLFSVEQYRLVSCSDCSHIMMHPQPSDAELGAIYDQNYALMHGTEEDRGHFSAIKQDTSRHYLEILAEYRGQQGGRLLEIGCGKGDLLAQASALGFEVTGVEYSEESCQAARHRLQGRGTIIQGEVGDVANSDGRFDVCVLADVIEHVRDPQHFLLQVHRLLAPGGALFIATPSLDSWSARFLRSRWMEFKPEHLHYFRQKTLTTLLVQCGYAQTVTLPGVKYLSPAYIFDHFKKYPVPRISFVTNVLSRVLPEPWQRKHLKLVASGMINISSKAEVADRKRLSIIVPAYNEAETLAPMLDRLLEKDLEPLGKEIIIIESNSKDGTREIALRYQDHPSVKLLLEDRPQGKGHAVRTGLANATGDFILIQDADLEYDMDDYDVLLEPLLRGRNAFVLGARHGGKAWKLRQFAGSRFASMVFNFGHWFFRTLLNLLYGTRLLDPFTMYKVFRRDCLTGLAFECNYFDFDYELVIKLVRKGFIPIEIPVNYRSRSFSEGKKVSIWRDPVTWIKALFKFRFTDLDLLRNAQLARKAAAETKNASKAANSVA